MSKHNEEKYGISYEIIALGKCSATAANSVFIELWLDVKHSTINHYFASVIN